LALAGGGGATKVFISVVQVEIFLILRFNRAQDEKYFSNVLPEIVLGGKAEVQHPYKNKIEGAQI
jgi:hypothetical protein